jgi:hypothetical protein
VGVDLDPPGSSEEKKKEASICIIYSSLPSIFEKQKSNSIAPLDLLRRVAPLQRHQIFDLEGASRLRPWRKSISRSSTSLIFFSIQGKPSSNHNPNS